LHEGPLPREECPICHKMVRTIQIKYHIQRHENTSRYECKECDKVFSHLATYQAHLKYSRPHASDQENLCGVIYNFFNPYTPHHTDPRQYTLYAHFAPKPAGASSGDDDDDDDSPAFRGV
ncbi:jg22760, partial [Pararge aegeria aegeria]